MATSTTLFMLRRKSTGRLLTVHIYAEGFGEQSGTSTTLEEMDPLSTGSLWYSEDMMDAENTANSDGRPHWTNESHTNPRHTFEGDIEPVLFGLLGVNPTPIVTHPVERMSAGVSVINPPGLLVVDELEIVPDGKGVI